MFHFTVQLMRFSITRYKGIENTCKNSFQKLTSRKKVLKILLIQKIWESIHLFPIGFERQCVCVWCTFHHFQIVSIAHCCIHRWRSAFHFVFAKLLCCEENRLNVPKSFFYAHNKTIWCCLSSYLAQKSWTEKMLNFIAKRRSFQYFIFYQKINFVHWHQY